VVSGSCRVAPPGRFFSGARLVRDAAGEGWAERGLRGGGGGCRGRGGRGGGGVGGGPGESVTGVTWLRWVVVCAAEFGRLGAGSEGG